MMPLLQDTADVTRQGIHGGDAPTRTSRTVAVIAGKTPHGLACGAPGVHR
jgi:hypothetical protein